ncbi:TIGR03943 family putative permease subunit [Guggenheimella bovis]
MKHVMEKAYLIFFALFYLSLNRILESSKIHDLVGYESFPFISLGAALVLVFFFSVLFLITHRKKELKKDASIMVLFLPILLGILFMPETRVVEEGKIEVEVTHTEFGETGALLERSDAELFQTVANQAYENFTNVSGKRFTLLGFTSQDERYKGNQFFLSRPLIREGAEEEVNVGFPCEVQGASFDKVGKWVEVTGTFVRRKNGGEVFPLFIVESIREVEAPESIYLYP